MTLHPRRRIIRLRLVTVLWLTVVWVLLWSDPSPGTVVAGLVLAILVAGALPMPQIPFEGRIHVRQTAYLLYRFFVDITVASFQVAVQALTPGRVPRGAVIGVPLRSHSDLYLTLTAELCSLVPGSIVVEAHRVTGVLYVHVLDVGMTGGVEGARRHVLDTEARVLRALASDRELAEAGLTRDPRDARRQEVAS